MKTLALSLILVALALLALSTLDFAAQGGALDRRSDVPSTLVEPEPVADVAPLWRVEWRGSRRFLRTDAGWHVWGTDSEWHLLPSNLVALEGLD